MARSPKKRIVSYATPTVQPDTEPPGFSTLGTVMLVCAVLCVGIVFAYAGTSWASALYRLLVDGFMLILWLAAAGGIGATILHWLPVTRAPVERLTPDAPAPSQTVLFAVTAIALGLGVFSLVVLGLGLAGWLNRLTAFALLGVGIALGAGLLAHAQKHASTSLADSARAFLNAPAGWAWLWIVAIPFLAIAIVAALLPPGTMWPSEPHGYDVVEYHLQIPREWYEAGKIFPLHHNAFSFFPFNVEMHYLLAMHLQGGAWAGMYLAHFMHLAMMVLTVLAIYGLSLRFGASRAVATIAGVAAATVPWLAQLGSIAYNEGGLLLFGALAMGWAFDAAIRPSRKLGRFPIAGLMAGFACGSKLTGVPEILVAVGGLAFLAILLTRGNGKGSAFLPLPLGEASGMGDCPRAGRGEGASSDESRITPTTSPHPNLLPEGEGTGSRSTSHEHQFPGTDLGAGRQIDEAPPVPLLLRLAGLATFFIAALLAFSPWLIRNEAWAGNSIFPEAASVLGQGHFSDAQVARWKQAHSPRPDQRSPFARVTAWSRDVWQNWQYGYLLLPLGLAAGLTTLTTKTAKRTASKIARADLPATAPSAIPLTADADNRTPHAAKTTNASKTTSAALSYSTVSHQETALEKYRHSHVLKNMRMTVFLLIAMFVGLSVVWLGFTHLQGRFFILGVPIAALLLGCWTGRHRTLIAAAVVLAALVGFARLHAVLAERLYDNQLSLLLGFESLPDVFVPQAFSDSLASRKPVSLVGDARAFVYPGPMSRLGYRTVFDVDAMPGESSVDAWSAGAPPGAVRLVDPNELRRFSDTYFGIPPLPSELQDRNEPFVLPPAN